MNAMAAARKLLSRSSLCLAVLLVHLPTVLGQAEDPFAILATVGQTVVRQSTVNTLNDQSLGGIFSGLAKLPVSQAISLQHCIDRATVLDYLVKRREETDLFDVSVAVDAFEQQLSRSETKLETWFQQKGMHRSDLEFMLIWQHFWTAHLQSLRQPNADGSSSTGASAGYRELLFERFGYQFNGTKVEVAQILIRVPAPELVANAMNNAEAIYGRLDAALKAAGANPGDATTERQSFDTAWKAEVMAHSDSPQRTDPKMPGYVGWIEFNTPMPAAFSAAAFATAPGNLSKPVRTRFGIHILRVITRQEGTRTIQQCEAPLDELMRREAFEAILELHREEVQIELVKPSTR